MSAVYSTFAIFIPEEGGSELPRLSWLAEDEEIEFPSIIPMLAVTTVCNWILHLNLKSYDDFCTEIHIDGKGTYDIYAVEGDPEKFIEAWKQENPNGIVTHLKYTNEEEEEC